MVFKLHEISLVAFMENRQNCCHQMLDFMAKMHQIRFRLGSAPDPAGGAYSAPPDPTASELILEWGGGRRGEARRWGSWGGDSQPLSTN